MRLRGIISDFFVENRLSDIIYKVIIKSISQSKIKHNEAVMLIISILLHIRIKPTVRSIVQE